MQKSISAKVYTRKIFNSSHSANTSHDALVHCTDLHQPLRYCYSQNGGVA